MREHLTLFVVLAPGGHEEFKFSQTSRPPQARDQVFKSGARWLIPAGSFVSTNPVAVHRVIPRCLKESGLVLRLVGDRPGKRVKAPISLASCGVDRHAGVDIENRNNPPPKHPLSGEAGPFGLWVAKPQPVAGFRSARLSTAFLPVFRWGHSVINRPDKKRSG